MICVECFCHHTIEIDTRLKLTYFARKGTQGQLYICMCSTISLCKLTEIRGGDLA